MVTDRFGMLLEEVGKILEVPDLHSDTHNSCLIKFKEGIEVQIEIDKHTEDFLIIGTDLGEIPAGKYRENIFLEALKANGMPYPRWGNFAYSAQTQHLMLFEMLSLHDLTGGQIASFLSQFLLKAKAWKDALATGNMPPLTITEGSLAKPGGIFGLKP